MKRWLLGLCCAALGASGWAQCADPKALHKYPSSGVELYFNLQVAMERDKALLKSLAGHYNNQSEAYVTYHAIVAPHVPTKPPFVLLNLIDPRKYDAKTFVPAPNGEGKTAAQKEDAALEIKNFVAFYEPDGKGGRRICRAEEWAIRNSWGQKPDDRRYQPEWAEPTLSNFPALKALTGGFSPVQIYAYRYDAAGRLTEWGIYAVPEWNAADREHVSPAGWPEQCFIYDTAGRLTQYVMQRRFGLPCTEATRENSSRMVYRYDASGRYVGSVQQSGKVVDREGEADFRWSEIYRLDPQPGTYHEAEADNRWGLRWVTGLPQIENVPDHRLPDSELRAIYRFPEPTPTAVMDGLPMSVKAYRRVRVGPATSLGTVSEMFPPNGGITERIFSRNMGGNVFRHERFNKDGKVYQVINDSWLDFEEPNGQYTEDHAVLRQVLAHPKINVPASHVRLRVYDVDPATGKQTLKALSWSKALPPEATRSPGRGGPIIDIYKDAKKAWANRGKAAPKPPTEEDLRVRYTDPQGKEIWRDWDVFLKATGFIEFERTFYPYGHPYVRGGGGPVGYTGPPVQ